MRGFWTCRRRVFVGDGSPRKRMCMTVNPNRKRKCVKCGGPKHMVMA